MKGAFDEVKGKTIEGIIIKNGRNHPPKWQIFLVFDDSTHFEFYSSENDQHLSGIGGVDKGGADRVRRYMSGACDIVFDNCDDAASATQ